MKLSIERSVNYFEVDTHFQATLASLFRNLQEAAINHADKVGFGAEVSEREKFGWVLHKLALRLTRYPRYRETLRIDTWSTGVSGVQGFRDFTVTAGEVEICQASTRWLFVNMQKRSLHRVPPRIVAAFEPESDDPLIPEVAAIEKDPLSDYDLCIPITTRYADFDSNGHVNNAAYADYFQTMSRRLLGDEIRATEIDLCFSREISRDTTEVSGRLKRDGNALRFNIRSGSVLHASGRAVLS